jgi:hypothetical protein
MQLIELRAENFKRLVAVRFRPTGAVTPITGKNGAGKSSVLDAIASALGGGALAPELPIRAGQTRAEVELDLGDIVVRRKWTAKGSTLEVLAKDGASYKSPQAVLDRLVGELSFDPLAFGRMKPSEQAATLAKVAGADLDAHKAERQRLFDQRAAVNRQAKELAGALALMARVPDGTPDEEVSLTAVLDELKAAEQGQREYDLVRRTKEAALLKFEAQGKRVAALRAELAEQEKLWAEMERESQSAAERLAAAPRPLDPEPIRQRGREAEGLNKAVRAKALRANREREAAAKAAESEALSAALSAHDAALETQLAAAPLPVPGLGIQAGGVTLGGIPFSQCSGAERLRASVAIALALNPKLKLMLIRDGSLLDDDGMRLLDELAAGAGAQVLIERVADGKAVGVRIVDGEVAAEAAEADEAKAA